MIKQQLEAFMGKVKDFEKQATKFNEHKKVLNQEQTKFKTIKELENEISVKILLNQSHHEWFEIS